MATRLELGQRLGQEFRGCRTVVKLISRPLGSEGRINRTLSRVAAEVFGPFAYLGDRLAGKSPTEVIRDGGRL